MKFVNALAATLVIVGALNWGLVALAGFDLVAEIFGLEFGETNAATRVIYGLVGLAGAYGLWALSCDPRSRHRRAPKRCIGISLMVHPPRRERTTNVHRMQTFLALVAIAAVAVAALGPAASARPRERGTIVETAVAAGQFETLAMLLKRAGLVTTLQQAGPYTVFAPTDAAFERVPKSTLKALLNDRAKLRSVLLYHVVVGKVTAAKVVKLSSARTANGKNIRIRVAGSSVFVNGSKVTKADVMASNGVIHVINRVLIPAA